MNPARAIRKPWCFSVVVVACAVAVAAVVVSPSLRFAWDAAGDARGIQFLCAKDAEFYVSQVRHVADGTYGHVNDFLYEWSRGERHAPPWTYSAVVGVHSVVGGSLHVAVIAAMALGAAVQFVLLTAIGRELRLGRALSLAAAAAACLVPFLWSYRGADLWLGHPERVTTGFLPLFRPVNPSLSSIPVWGALLALACWIRSPTRFRWCVLAVLVAIQWTAYPAAFLTSGALVVGAAVVVSAGGRSRLALLTLCAAAAAAVVNAPVVIATMRRVSGDDVSALHSNLIALPSRAPLMSANTATAIVIAVVWGVLRRRRRPDLARRALVVGAPLALVLLFNQQVVTGRLDQPFHYDWFWAVPLIWLSSAVLLSELRGRVRIAAAHLGRPAARRVASGMIAVPAIIVAAAAVSGGPGAALLRAVGIIRAAAVLRPAVLVAGALAAAALALFLLELLRRHRWRQVRTVLSAVAITVAFAAGWRSQDFEYQRRRDGVIALQRVAGALDFLKEHGTPDDVVACSDDDVARLVPSYTGRNVLVSAETQFAPMPPDAEHRRRRYVALALFGLAPEDLAAGLGDGARWHAAIFKWRTFGPPPPSVAAVGSGLHAATLELGADAVAVAEYTRYFTWPRAALLREFRLDWVVWRPESEKSGLRDPGQGDGLRLAFDDGDVRVYRVE